ncbi:MAG: hypothetical protein II208_02730 [Alphaproteobacteria bacterium]|nr:hypothetical protein [Alphaproteobacteria bacterium]
MKKNKKQNRNLTDVIAILTILGGLCGMIYTVASDFESDKEQTRSMAGSCMASLAGAMILTMREGKRR